MKENRLGDVFSEHFYPIMGDIAVYDGNYDTLVYISPKAIIPKDHDRNLIYLLKLSDASNIEFDRTYKYIFDIYSPYKLGHIDITRAELRGLLTIHNETIEIDKITYYICECVHEIIDNKKVICNLYEFSAAGGQ